MSRVLLKGGLSGVIDMIRDGRPRVQQAYLNILNLVYCSAYWEKGNNYNSTSGLNSSSSDSPLLSTRLFFIKAHTSLLPILIRLVDQGSSMPTRSKALLAAQFICRYRPILTSALCDRRLLTAVTKVIETPTDNRGEAPVIKQDGYTYIEKCVRCVLYFVKSIFASMMENIIQSMEQNLTERKGMKKIDTPSQKTSSSPREKYSNSPAVGSSPNIESSRVENDDSNDASSTIAGYCSTFRAVSNMLAIPSLRCHVLSVEGISILAKLIMLLTKINEDAYHHHSHGSSTSENYSSAEEFVFLALESISQVILLTSLLLWIHEWTSPIIR